MSNFIYYKDKIPVNLDRCNFIYFENIHEDYNIIFYVYQGYGKTWTFNNSDERDKVYERIKYYYAKDLEHIKDRLDE